MKHNVVAPSVGESVSEVSILKWAKQDGQAVKVGDLLIEIESDKATVEVVAEHAGAIQILKPEGERVPIGALLATIDDAVKGKEIAASASAPAAKTAAPKAAPTSVASSPALDRSGPAARKAATEGGVNPSQVQATGRGGRLTKADILSFLAGGGSAEAPSAKANDRPGDRRVPMTLLRQRIAERLVYAQQTAAILTTFNEVDMSAVMKLRAEHKDAFKAKHGVSLGFMSFFARASIEAMKITPEVNAMVDGKDIVYHDYVDLGVAVGSDRGLVVPVVREAHKMGFAEIEKSISELATKAKDGKLSVAELSGGTFTISNGGVYGSLLSTPILNPPQSGILGMHKIQERPIAVNGKVEIRPMMYLALSYDHRLIDGKGAVSFLVALKENLENPEKLGLKY